MNKLRTYQRIAIEQTRRALRKHESAVLQMPTGAGKTRVASDIITTARGTIWFICHRREIIRQAAKTFDAAGIKFGVISPSHPFEPSARVQIASIQTLANRVRKLPKPSLVLWDECHHAVSASWLKIRKATKSAKHIGLTATPERLDGKGLNGAFDSLVLGPSIKQLIAKKHLSPFRYFAPSEPDLTKARMSGKDYRKGDIGRIMNSSVLIGDAVSEYKRNLRGKRALVFAASVEASVAIVRKFNKEGVKAAHIDAKTPVAERDARIADLAAGRIKVLSNVEVFTEGFDLPAIDAVILMRPTKSLALFLQMVGRALRNADGKKEALVFDHAGLWLDHDFPDSNWKWSLNGKARDTRLVERCADGGRLRQCPECKEVYAERVERCRCGHKFKSGREIGEHDGQLYELRSAVPEGAHSFPVIAKIMGADPETIRRWAAKGMPVAAPGYAIERDVRQWAARNSTFSDGVSQVQFAKAIGVDKSNVHAFVAQGMPIDANSKVDVERANEWLRLRGNPHIRIAERKQGRLKTGTYLKKTFGCDVYRLVKSGMPRCKKTGLFDEMVCVEWMNQNWKPVTNACNYENRLAFSRRIGCDQSSVTRWARNGMPTHSANGWVHIQRCLEWVRDNTNIQIPASAWPKATKSRKRDASIEARASL